VFGSWRLGTAFGINVLVHWTFLFLPTYLIFSGAGSESGSALFFVLALVAAVFGCVVLHELGHALMARRFGIDTKDITLYPIGGVARLERMSERPWEEFWIAIAGPAVNVAIAAILALALFITTPVTAMPSPSLLAVEFAVHLLIANLFLVGFNLLPAFPMDGGRVLRALLACRLGRLRATEIAVTVAVFVAVGLFVYGLHVGQPFLVLGAAFVFFAGRQELTAVRMRETARPNVEIIARNVHDSSSRQSAMDAVRSGFTGFRWDSRASVWVYWRDGQPIQTVSAE
jgi:Zn-dependent protease